MSPSPPKLESFILPDSFLYIPNSSRDFSSGCSPSHIIFFIPGNPGLISYYHTFLSLLSDPKTSRSTSGCVIAGFSLGGFEVSERGWNDDDYAGRSLSHPASGPVGPLYSLQEQIKLTAARIRGLIKTLQEQWRRRNEQTSVNGGTGSRGLKVILMGHSVGAYIALEVLRLHRQQQSAWRSSSTFCDLGVEEAEDFEVRAAILLTPTIVDIALSSSGRVAAPVLEYVPGFPLLVSLGAKFVTRFLPETWLRWIVKKVMGRDTPDDAVLSTVSFLRSRNGVRQSLGMAADEMKEIGHDGWGEEIWGFADASKVDFEDRGRRLAMPAELVFFFAKSDHWVADQTREAIIRSRGGGGETGKPSMVIAEHNELVHGWCIRHNAFVAQKVDKWIEEIISEMMTTAQNCGN